MARMTLVDVCVPEMILERKSTMMGPHLLPGASNPIDRKRHRTIRWETIQIEKCGMGHKEIGLRLRIEDLQGPLRLTDTILQTCPSHPIRIRTDHHHRTSIAEDSVGVDADSEEAEDDLIWVAVDLMVEGSTARTAIFPSAKMLDRLATMGQDLTIVRWRKVESEWRKIIVKRSRR